MVLKSRGSRMYQKNNYIVKYAIIDMYYIHVHE